MSTTKENGVHFVDRSEYDALPRVNFSKLKHLGRSAAHFQHQLLAKDEDTDALIRGRATHLAVFEPELFRANCVVWDCGSRRGKEWEAFCSRNHDKEILTEGMHEAALAIGQAARKDAVASKYLSAGKGEVTVLWRYDSEEQVEDVRQVNGRTEFFKRPVWGVDCKSRIDFVAELGALVDLKTCRDASPGGFGRAADSYGYCIQGAFYVDAYKQVTGKELPYFFVAAEDKAPYVVQVYRLTNEQLELGRERYRELLTFYNDCRTRNVWPGYADDVMDLQLPQWAMPQEDEVEDLGITIGGTTAVGF